MMIPGTKQRVLREKAIRAGIKDVLAESPPEFQEEVFQAVLHSDIDTEDALFPMMLFMAAIGITANQMPLEQRIAHSHRTQSIAYHLGKVLGWVGHTFTSGAKK